MPLLTASENHALQSFLASLDHAAIDGDDADALPAEWALYARDLGLPDDAPPPPPKDVRALARATKQLMSLSAPQQPVAYPPPPTHPDAQARPLAAPPSLFHRTPSDTWVPPSAPHPAKRSVTEHGAPPKRRRTASPAASSAAASSSQGPAKAPKLLSPSQKKANHIQSEQKRRANIRRGYEALCETVPSLRDAIRALEAEGTQPEPEPEKGKGKKKRGKAKAGDDADKADGRVGPRSECVVLQRSIDYLQDLLSERATLVSRLAHARGSLAPGHPALVPLQTYDMHGAPHPQPLWEREWTGGTGGMGDDEDGGSEDDGMGS